MDALTYFVEQVMPLLRRRRRPPLLLVVGIGAASVVGLAAPDVMVIGEVPDVRPEIEKAAVIVAPLRVGGGTRLKILEAMAMGRPVVATSMGAEGIAAQPSSEILIADEPIAFAREVGRVLDEPAVAQSIGEAGRRLVERRYEWSASARRLEELQSRALQSRHLGMAASFSRKS